MITYNKKELLVSLHLTKCGGTSFNRLLRLWFHLGFHRHYFNNKTTQLPKKLEISGLKKIFPLCVHGHFKVESPYELNNYYSEAKQFITVFRDPLSAHISTYTYIQQCIKENSFYDSNGKLVMKNIADDINDFVENHSGGMLNCFPFKIDKDNYKDIINDNFIHVGVIERIDTSLKNFASKLYKPFIKMPVLNSSSKFKGIEQVNEKSKRIFMEKHELHYLIYNYAIKLNI